MSSLYIIESKTGDNVANETDAGAESERLALFLNDCADCNPKFRDAVSKRITALVAADFEARIAEAKRAAIARCLKPGVSALSAFLARVAQRKTGCAS